MRVGGAAQGGGWLVPLGGPAGTGRTPQSRLEQVEPVDPGADTRAGFSAAFATQRHPYVRIEPRDAAEAALRRREQTRPQGAFLTQYLAQETPRDGLSIDHAAEQVGAYRRASRPLVEIRGGANVDIAA